MNRLIDVTFVASALPRTWPGRVPSLLIVAALLFGAAGCQWQQPRPVPIDQTEVSQSVIIHAPPKELIARLVRQLPQPPLALPVENVQDGNIYTGFREYEGAVHIIRRWRERTRFKIVVLPDFNDPLGTSHVEVLDQTEEKPSDEQPWYANPHLRRPERAAEVMRVIQSDSTR